MPQAHLPIPPRCFFLAGSSTSEIGVETVGGIPVSAYASYEETPVILSAVSKICRRGVCWQHGKRNLWRRARRRFWRGSCRIKRRILLGSMGIYQCV
ncbi:MAG: hypothetical protein ACMUIM_05850 [bacterium]